VYLYAANNPSEGALAKRRAAATLISYLTPTITEAGLYKGLIELKQSLERWRSADESDQTDRVSLLQMIHEQALALDLQVPSLDDVTAHGADLSIHPLGRCTAGPTARIGVRLDT
jgi:magnesium chelatase subunit H